jgi:hypothetical protein
MNIKNLLHAAALASGLFSASFASASPAKDNAVSSNTESYSAPTPLKIVTPSGIPRRFQNETIRLSLTVDAMGRPRNIHLLSERDPALARHLLPVVAQWTFTPAIRNGRPVSSDIVLPIELVDQSAS